MRFRDNTCDPSAKEFSIKCRRDAAARIVGREVICKCHPRATNHVAMFAGNTIDPIACGLIPFKYIAALPSGTVS